MKRNAGRIQRSRQRLANGLKRLGYQVYLSHSNFVLARQRDKNLKPVYEELKRRKILVRYFDTPGLRDCLRISVGAPKELRSLLNELATIPI
jgi:histidinol-phosphate aminotransferase